MWRGRFPECTRCDRPVREVEANGPRWIPNACPALVNSTGKFGSQNPGPQLPSRAPWRTVLTDYIQMHEVAHVGRRRDLALVDARVAMLRIFDLQAPVFRVRMMYRPEPLIGGVRVAAHRQQMDVPVAHPRHLQQHL